MRDANRLDNVYEEIKEIHKKMFTDWRVSQLFLNFFSWHLNTYGTDGFYIEEDTFIQRFKEFTMDFTRY